MILQTFNSALYNESYNYWIADLREDNINKHDLRMQFDNSLLDSHAKACIDRAKELGYLELASEMELDLEIELC